MHNCVCHLEIRQSVYMIWLSCCHLEAFVLDIRGSKFLPKCYFFCVAGDFIYKVSSTSPTKHFIIHSRKALLNGISPAENRSIPPLKYVVFYLIYVISVLRLQLEAQTKLS